MPVVTLLLGSVTEKTYCHSVHTLVMTFPFLVIVVFWGMVVVPIEVEFVTLIEFAGQLVWNQSHAIVPAEAIGMSRKTIKIAILMLPPESRIYQIIYVHILPCA